MIMATSTIKKKADTYDWGEPNPDLNVPLITDVNQGGSKSQSALQSHSGNTAWRFLMQQDGRPVIWKTTDKGANWNVAGVYPKILVGTSSSKTVTFPSAFKSAPHIFVTTASSSDSATFGASVYDITTTGFKAKTKYVNPDQIGDAGESFYWLAIGDYPN